MNQNDFQALQKDIKSLFSALYLIDVDQLGSDQRRQHQQALAAAYLALLNTENLNYSELGTQVKNELSELAWQVRAMREGVSGLASPHEKLDVLAKGLDALARLVKIV